MTEPRFENPRENAMFVLGGDMLMAHRVIFREQHSNRTAPFHEEIITDWHSSAPYVLDMAFRGAGKSTLSEEAITIETAFRRVKNVVILGESETRAVERLRTIKYMLLTNEGIQELFALGPGEIWTETKALLSNGVYLQAYGRGQSLRGVKHLEQRPDLILIDDLEDEEAVRTPEARLKTLIYFTKVVLPSLAPNGRIRVVGTPLHPESLIQRFYTAPGWIAKRYPIYFRNEAGELEATWPDRYSVEWALGKKNALEDLGRADDFVQEYLCEPTNPATQTFTQDMIKVIPQIRSWHAVFAMYDPARTTHKKSATTGKAVWSWIGHKLVIWAASAKKWMPNEIVDDMFEVDNEFNPVTLGVEETGLNEFLLQPIRTAQRERGHILPLRPLNAPKGKFDFIRGLQPYFRAGEVEFACDLPDLQKQLLGFPTGEIDAPNALAYALRMKLGVAVYDNFGVDNIAEEIRVSQRAQLWIAINSNGSCTTAILAQIAFGQLSIIADVLVEGSPDIWLYDIIQEVSLSLPTFQTKAGEKYTQTEFNRAQAKIIAPRMHWDRSQIGLTAAAKAIPLTVMRGGDEMMGRQEIQGLFNSKAHGMPALRVDMAARWTLRAFAGGYCRPIDKIEPDPASPYTVLMQGLEALTGMLRGVEPIDNSRNLAYTPEGRPYHSARAR